MKYDDKLVERALKLVKLFADFSDKRRGAFFWEGQNLTDEARAIVAELPDPDLEAARAIIRQHIDEFLFLNFDEQLAATSFAERCIVEALKHGRANP